MFFELRVSDGDPEVAYLRLPASADPSDATERRVLRTVRLSDLMPYQGPDVYLDLDASGRLIGIELLN